MDKKTWIEEMENLQEQVKELFRESVTEDVYHLWADTFEIAEVDEKEITVT